MTKHQKALIWLTKMEPGRTYHPSEEQKEILLDVFLDQYLVLPTKSMVEYNYYFNIGMNFETISKNLLS